MSEENIAEFLSNLRTFLVTLGKELPKVLDNPDLLNLEDYTVKLWLKAAESLGIARLTNDNRVMINKSALLDLIERLKRVFKCLRSSYPQC